MLGNDGRQGKVRKCKAKRSIPRLECSVTLIYRLNLAGFQRIEPGNSRPNSSEHVFLAPLAGLIKQVNAVSAEAYLYHGSSCLITDPARHNQSLLQQRAVVPQKIAKSAADLIHRQVFPLR
jgi:hypothetical protein